MEIEDKFGSPEFLVKMRNAWSRSEWKYGAHNADPTWKKGKIYFFYKLFYSL